MNTITEVCTCEDEFTCEFHIAEDSRTYARLLGLTPAPYDASGAYDPSDFKGRFYEGWDAA